ncbi:hypothetical protein ASF73_20320 [Xanthomonas sp. Leaf131]|nr:hypothetical protein ASF73_20320 [Xanthomonas sp. Leaf131]
MTQGENALDEMLRALSAQQPTETPALATQRQPTRPDAVAPLHPASTSKDTSMHDDTQPTPPNQTPATNAQPLAAQLEAALQAAQAQVEQAMAAADMAVQAAMQAANAAIASAGNGRAVDSAAQALQQASQAAAAAAQEQAEQAINATSTRTPNADGETAG